MDGSHSGTPRLIRLAIAAVIALAALSGSCGSPQTRTTYDTLKIPDERTAVVWIAKAFKREGLEVEAERPIRIASDATLNADVSAVDKPWSVVWLSPDELVELKGKLPPAPPGLADGALWVHRGIGEDDGQRMLILLAKDYEYDPDPRGEGVVRSIEEVEARTVKDVSDFLVRAKKGELN